MDLLKYVRGSTDAHGQRRIPKDVILFTSYTHLDKILCSGDYYIDANKVMCVCREDFL